MRLTIFWRSMLAQSILIGLILLISLYSHVRLNGLTELGETLVTKDSEVVKEGKQLLKISLSQIRIGEKYVLFNDPGMKESFLSSSFQFRETLDQLAGHVDSLAEKETLRRIEQLHEDYVREVETVAGAQIEGDRDNGKRQEISDRILEKTREFIQVREEAIGVKMTEARDLAAEAAGRIAWIALLGVSGALLLAYFHARAVSDPLRRLARAMRRVGQGEFSRTLDIKAPREVHDLSVTFNWMTEKLEELDRLKSDFTAHFSHELRTPLTAIREGTSLLLEELPGRLNESQKEILGVIHSHTEQLFQTISSILDLSKMEAQLMEYEFVPCDFGEIIARSLQKVNLIAKRKRVSLEVHMEEDLPLLHLDEKRMQQVVDNLLSNALKFTPEGGTIVLNVELSQAVQGNSPELNVCVRDSGEGIPLEEQRMIFERYYQGGNGKLGSQQGTGLGLALARFIVEAHRGKIWVESELGRGAAFIFSLPLESSNVPVCQT